MSNIYLTAKRLCNWKHDSYARQLLCVRVASLKSNVVTDIMATAKYLSTGICKLQTAYTFLKDLFDANILIDGTAVSFDNVHFVYARVNDEYRTFGVFNNKSAARQFRQELLNLFDGAHANVISVK